MQSTQILYKNGFATTKNFPIANSINNTELCFHNVSSFFKMMKLKCTRKFLARIHTYKINNFFINSKY